MDDNDSAHSWLKHFNGPPPSELDVEAAKKILEHPHALMPPPTDGSAWSDYNLETLRHVLVLLFPIDIHSRAAFYAAIVVQVEQNAIFVKQLTDIRDNSPSNN